MSGPIDARVTDIVDRVAENVHGDPTDEWIASSVDAAVDMVTIRTARDDIGLPDDEATVNGLVLLAIRIYTDTPGGAQVAVADPTFEPIFQPENLWKHVRHYFNHLFGYVPDDVGPKGWGVG